MNVNTETLIGLVRSAFKEGRGSLFPNSMDPKIEEAAWQKSEAHGFLEELVHDQAKNPTMEQKFNEELDQR